MSTFVVQDVINDVRDAVQDTNSSNYRYSDAQITRAVNQIIKRMALLRPDLFSNIITYTCTAGSLQTLPTDSYRLMDIFQVVGGNNVNEVNREAIDLLSATWQSGTQGVAQDWMRHVRNPNIFFVYPPSLSGQQLILEYCQAPTNYTINQSISHLSDVYFPCVVDGVVWVLESVDNEHVNSGRAKAAGDSFLQLLDVTVQSKPVTDTEQGGLDPKMVK
jgi:hypothetical protein